MENKKRIPDGRTAAICGLFCGTCPSFPENCHGCLSDQLTDYCQDCPNGFRDCAKQHSVVRCNECEEFPCGRLEYFTKQHYQNGIGHHEMVINDLRDMNEIGTEQWVQKQIQEHTCPRCGKLIYWFDINSHRCSI